MPTRKPSQRLIHQIGECTVCENQMQVTCRATARPRWICEDCRQRRESLSWWVAVALVVALAVMALAVGNAERSGGEAGSVVEANG